MKSLILAALLFAGSDPVADGLRLYQAGEYQAAAQAFSEALQRQPDSAKLHYNLALALWRAGQTAEAETHAEMAATLSGGKLAPLRDGLLGNLRFAAAQSKAEEDLKEALKLAKSARRFYQSGALLPSAAQPELRRNLERALLLQKELEEKLKEQEEKEKEEQKDKDKSKDDKDDKDKDEKDKDQKDKDKKDQDKKDQQKDGEQEDPQDGDAKPEPEPKPSEQEDKKEEKSGGQGKSEAPPPVPGEGDPDKELSQEERQHILRQLEGMEDDMQELRKKMRRRRAKVEKDW